MIDQIKFPVICVDKHLLRVRESYRELITTTSAGVKNGMFKNLRIIDSEGNCFVVNDARKVRGIGLLRGYNIFLNQKIIVELQFSSKISKLDIEGVKIEVSKSFKKWQGWTTRDDFEELKIKLEKAQSIKDIISLIGR